MTPEERQLLGGLFDRVRDNAGSVQRDAEAEAFINNAVKAQPYASYMLAQAVIVQEETLKGAVAKIEELEAKVQELEARATAPAPQPAAGGFLGGIGRSVFGNPAPQPAPAPGAMGMARSGVPSTSGINVPLPPGGGGYGQQQPPIGQPSPWQQPQQQGGGSSFLKGALGAAAGVAGGMLLANAVSGMFRGSGDQNSQTAGMGKSQEKLESPLDNKSSSWDDTGQASGDNWSSAPASNNDSWDNASASGSGDDWGASDSGGGDSWGGDE